MLFKKLFSKKKNAAPEPETKELPPEQARAIIDKMNEKTAMQGFRLTVDASRKPGLRGSKFGGVPYWDRPEEYPCDSAGKKMLLLAQIDLGDVSGCDMLPERGLLQFFIADDGMCGLDGGCRVVYHRSTDEAISEADVLALGIPQLVGYDSETGDWGPIDRELAVNIEPAVVSMGTADYRFDDLFRQTARELGIELPEGAAIFELDEDLYGEQSVINTGHWLLGYPYFTQGDPREYTADLSDRDIMLLQIDSDFGKDKDYEIMWGDCGVGNFFIRAEDLKNRDFSRVFFTWDCC